MKGDAQYDGEWTDFTAEFNVDTESSRSLVAHLKGTGNLVEILTIG